MVMKLDNVAIPLSYVHVVVYVHRLCTWRLAPTNTQESNQTPRIKYDVSKGANSTSGGGRGGFFIPLARAIWAAASFAPKQTGVPLDETAERGGEYGLK